MVAPANYMAAFAPARPAGGMFQDYKEIMAIRQHRADREMANQQRQLAAKKAAQYEADVAALGDSPTVAGMAGLFLKHPEAGAKLKDVFTGMREEEAKNHIGNAQRIQAALGSGQPVYAYQEAMDISDAYRNAGDENRARQYESLAELIERDPTQGNFLVSGLIASQNPEKYAESQEALLTMQAT